MKRKSPVRHRVRNHIRKNRLVRSYIRGHGGNPVKQVRRIINPNRNVQTKKKTYIEEFKSDLRFGLRWAALNMYGKKVNELTIAELKNVLQDVLTRYKPLFVETAAEGKLYLDVFKEVFKSELSKIKEKQASKVLNPYESRIEEGIEIRSHIRLKTPDFWSVWIQEKDGSWSLEAEHASKEGALKKAKMLKESGEKVFIEEEVEK